MLEKELLFQPVFLSQQVQTIRAQIKVLVTCISLKVTAHMEVCLGQARTQCINPIKGLIRGIYKQVTSFILKKVAQQISSLEIIDNFMQNQQQQQVNESNNVRSHLRSEVNSELHDFYPDFNSQLQTNVDQCFNPLQRTDLKPCLNSQQMNNFNPSFNQQQSNYCDFNSHANSDPTNSRFGRRQPSIRRSTLCSTEKLRMERTTQETATSKRQRE